MSEDTEDIYSAIYVLFFINRLIGTAPFILTKSPNRRYKMKFYFIIISIINISGYCAYVWYSTLESNEKESANNIVSNISQGVLSVIFIMFGFFRSNNLIEGFKLLKNIDDTLKTLGIRLNYRQTRNRIWIQLFCLLTFLMIGVVCGNEALRLHSLLHIHLSYFVASIQAVLVLLFEIQYFVYIHMAFVRYKIINQYLETFCTEKQMFCDVPKKNKIKSLKGKKTSTALLKPANILFKPLFILETISDVHTQLTDMCILFNKAFSIQLLFRIGVAFISIIFCLFFAIWDFTLSYDTGRESKIWLILSSCSIFYFTEMYALTRVSDKTSQEAKNCPLLLHKIKHTCTNPDILNAIELYSLQMYHNKLQFTVCGLFPIDHSLLYSMTGAMTTYLIFLVQFSKSSTFRDTVVNGNKSVHIEI